jgi:hypothetical protein
MATRAKWTFMLYLAGDNNLSAAGEKDLGEMRKVGSTPEVNIVAEFDRAGPQHETQRYHIERDGVNEQAESLGETDSGDPNVLLGFIRWAAKNYPADRYALVLWNHGGGWEPDDLDQIATSVKANDYTVREAGDRSARSTRGRILFRSTQKKLMRLPTAADRAICYDDGSGHSLDTIELGNVLSKTVTALGQPLDLLGMDACLMSDLEVAYQARPYVKHIVASEESEPNDGWPYDAVFGKLVANPDLPTAELAAHIVQVYVQYYVDRHFSGDVTQSALDLSQLDSLTGPLDLLSGALSPRMKVGKYELGEALFRTSGSFYDGKLWDIAEVCKELAAETADDATRQAAEAVQAALQPKSGLFVIAEGHHGNKVKGCGGVSIYLPPRVLYRVSPFYADLEYAKDHTWDEMLTAYHAA